MEVCGCSGHILSLLLLLTALISLCDGCVPGCQCTMAGTSKRQRGRKVDCVQHSAPFTTLANISFPPDTVHLNLAHNALIFLKRASFIQLSSLQKLNMSNNQISIIEPGAFDGLQSVKKLDLSRNHIGTINSNMFTGLPSLERLFLTDNRISVIPDGTFNDLRSLKRIEFSSDYLRCDCHLKWILKWTKTRHVRFPEATVCALPIKMKGRPLSKLKRKDLHCDHKVQLLIFDTQPSESQLVFQGDKLPFECNASVISGEMKIAWFRGGQLVTTNKTTGVFVNTSHNLDHTVINHRLVVESLDSSHTGEWSCVVTTDTHNFTKTVHVDVRTPERTLECPPVTNHTAKGTYFWDKSMAGILVSKPCQRGDTGVMATHKCGLDGRWRNMNVSSCSYIKDITHRLARLAKADFGVSDIPTLRNNITKALETAARTGESMDSIDVMYLSKIMDMLLPYATTDTELVSLLVGLVSKVSSLPQEVVETAQTEYRSPSRMISMLEEMSEQINTEVSNLQWAWQSENIVVMVLSQQRLLQNGITCVLREGWDHVQHQATGTQFYCSNFVPEMNAPVFVQIPAVQPKKFLYNVVDSGMTSTAGNDYLTQNPAGNNNSHLVSNETFLAALLDSSTLTPQGEEHLGLLVPHPIIKLDFTPAGNSGGRSNQSSTFSPFLLPANQLEALNVSSQQLSKLSKSVNTSTETLQDPPPSLDISSQQLFPFVKKPVITLASPVITPIRPVITNASPVITPASPNHAASQSGQTNAYIILYRNGRLFPVIPSQVGDDAVITPVITVSLGGQAQNMSDPVVIKFEVSDTRRPLKAAYFDFTIMDGLGGWRSDGCEIVHINGSIITVRVQHLSNLALLQDTSYMYRLAMEPVVYVGSGICMLSLLIVVITFITCFRSIGIPKKLKHAVVNICLTTWLLMVAFVLGINRTDMELLCQVAGICIHYLTLSAVFWITISSSIIYKKLRKVNRPPEPELVLTPLPPKPVLQFYFVGYGVPVIICGITAAVNLNFYYAGLQYCFLKWDHSLGAFYAPVALLVAWNLVLFMRISCILRSVSEAESEAANESDHEIHTNEIELVPSQPDTTMAITHLMSSDNSNNNNNNVSGNSGNGYCRRYSRAGSDEDGEDDDEGSVSVKSLPDQERRPLTQLRSVVAILFLFIVMWMCAALAVAKPFHLIIPHQGTIFSYIYGLMSSLFGIFMVCYFCITRKDSWLSWKQAGGCASLETYSIPVEVTEPQTELAPPSQPPVNGSVIKSNSNSNLSVYSQKSSNITKAYNMKNSSNSKLSNVDLIMPNSSEASLAPAQENFPNFYNPRQNGAAKKFWQKNRHHSKVMNKDINRDLNSGVTDNNLGVGMEHHLQDHDTCSDANIHLSIETHIQANDKQGPFSGLKEIPVDINNYHRAGSQNFLGSSCRTMSLEQNYQTLGLRLAADTGQTFYRDTPHGSLSGLNSQLPQQQRSTSSGSLGAGAHPSAFTPVQPRSSLILAHQSKSEGEVLQQRQEGTVTRTSSQTQDLDGQGQSNEARQRPPNPGIAWNPLHCHLPPLSSHPTGYSFTPPLSIHSQQQHYPFDFGGCPTSLSVNAHAYNINQSRPFDLSSSQFVQHAHLAPFNIPPSPYLPQSQTRGPVQSLSPCSSSSQSQSNRKQRFIGSSWRPVSGGDSSDSSRPRHKHAVRTVTYALNSPVMSDSQGYEPRYTRNQKGAKKARSIDSDHHSDPTHRKRNHRSDRHSKNKLSHRQRSLGWDEQFKGRPSKVNYVYVNHMYRDKVMHKLIKQASESDDLAKKAFWLPRSASEYERLTQKGFCNMAEDSCSSSADEDSLDDNVWIRQSSGSDFNKKETSV